MTIDEQLQVLSRRAERILGEDDLRRKLASGRPLRIKLGVDPTATDLTLGNAVPLRIVRQFQEWGHKAILIIGDYTARVGDPSGRNELRPMLSGEQIDANAKRFAEQAGKILLTDADHLETHFNGTWLGKMDLLDIIKLACRKSVAQILTRDDFAKRYAAGVDIRLHEILYPLLQGWDSVMINADVEMGGSDQLFNNLVGREFQKEEGKEGQVVIVTPLLIGTDGVVKMSKSKGNYIGVTDPPNGRDGMFGKIMSLPDALLDSYYTLLTDLPADDFRPMIQDKPRDAKVRLAKIIITWLHSSTDAEAAEAEFIKVIRDKGMPDEMPSVEVDAGDQTIAPLLVRAGMVASNSEGIRKIREGAVKLDGEKVADTKQVISVTRPIILQMGNRKFARLISRPE